MQEKPMNQISKPALPLPEPLRGSVVGSFAQFTVTERMPRIGREALEENRFPPENERCIQKLIEGIPEEPVRRLEDPGSPDLAEWQEHVQPYLGQSWLQVPWFFAEEYFYRRLLEASGYFQPGPTRNFDPFEAQKKKVLEASAGAIGELAGLLGEALGSGKSTERDLYLLLLNSAWGNQGDLSIWSTHEERPDHNDLEVQESHLLINEAQSIADHILRAPAPMERVIIILDNCGPELVADLGLVDYLLSANLVQSVQLQAKAHPTFVSDALIKDIYQTIEHFNSRPDSDVQAWTQRLTSQISQGRLEMGQDFFWNSPKFLWEMPGHIRQELSAAGLVISKGDANYRRLVGDFYWDTATPFAEVVGYFPAPLAVLRVLKAELIIGLAAGRAEQLDAKDPGWMVNGRWGVIHFLDRAPWRS